MNKKNILGNPQHYGVWVGEFLNVTLNDNPPLSINNHGNNIDSNQLTRRHTEMFTRPLQDANDEISSLRP